MPRRTSFYRFIIIKLPGLSHTERAKKLGVPLTTLRGWENPERVPSLKTIAKVAKALGVNQSEICDWLEQGGVL